MQVKIYLNKTVEENAAEYFEKAKKAKKKLEGVKKALEEMRKKLAGLEKKQALDLKEIKEQEEIKSREKRWYEKFRWFISSEGFLCVGGRDATSNEVLIKKHTEKNDIVFHTDMAGSPFFVVKTQSVLRMPETKVSEHVKTENKKVNEATLNECAIATASFSRAWKLGMNGLEVFYVKPDQVSKKAKAGEFLPKGAFMIYGETKYIKAKVELAVGVYENILMCGPVDAVKANCSKYVKVMQGNEKLSDAAKRLKKMFDVKLSMDDIIRILPAGGVKIVQ